MIASERLVPIQSNHGHRDEPFSRLLFYSVLIHYTAFFLLFGNPFLLIFGDEKHRSNDERGFDIDLLSLPGTEKSSNEALLGLFPPEVTHHTTENKTEGHLEPVASGRSEVELDLNGKLDQERVPDIENINQLKPEEGGNPAVSSRFQREGSRALPDVPLPLITSKKLPPNMTGPQDCMIKVVSMVCPNGDLGCIRAYKEFCASLPD